MGRGFAIGRATLAPCGASKHRLFGKRSIKRDDASPASGCLRKVVAFPRDVVRFLTGFSARDNLAGKNAIEARFARRVAGTLVESGGQGARAIA